jgi:hypothetical protein
MHSLVSDQTRYHLHGAIGIFISSADINLLRQPSLRYTGFTPEIFFQLPELLGQSSARINRPLAGPVMLKLEESTRWQSCRIIRLVTRKTHEFPEFFIRFLK